MTNCPVCQRETSPIKIGSQSYCNICGTALAGKPQVASTAPAPAAPARRLSMDLAPRAAASNPTPVAATPTPKPGTSAAALHGRVKASRVLDLRHAEPKRVAPAPVAPATQAHGIPAAPPHSTAHERHLAHLDMRLAQARQVERSVHIQKFGAPTKTPVQMAPVAAPAAPEPRPIIPETRPVIIEPELPRHVITQHEAMTKLAHHPAAPVPAPKPQRAPKARFTGHHSRTFATVTAVVLMGGYIWMSNYPKFALQNASNQAGLAASLPGYLPSSYSLKSTTTAPGLVTLNFASPSADEHLKIAQHRTTWDSSSLLDNFVAKTADDYSTVQSQGLTIYLWGNNQASWVNHGIWYSIEGASRLSREQILKIAYSL